MKRLVLVLATLAFMASTAAAQLSWDFYAYWVNDTMLAGMKSPYGVAVDGNGKIWMGLYSSRSYTDDAGALQYPDSIWVVTPTDTTVYYEKPVFAFDPVSGKIDTVYFEFEDGTVDTVTDGVRGGMATTPDGDIVVGKYDVIYVIDHLTYKVKLKIDLTTELTGTSLGGLEVDANGYIYATSLHGSTPVWILDPADGSVSNTVAASLTSLQRTIAVTPDGKDVYIGAISGPNGAPHYHSDLGPAGLYTLVDTIFNEVILPDGLGGLDTLSVPTNDVELSPDGILYMGTVEEAAAKLFWGLDPAQGYAIVDSGSIPFSVQDSIQTTIDGKDTTVVTLRTGAVRAPRDVAWSHSGDVMWIADMYNAIGHPDYPGVDYVMKAYVKEGATISTKELRDILPQGYFLSENYPNPFNPSTSFSYEIPRDEVVTVAIYNLRGQLVSTLVSGYQSAGEHHVTWDGRNEAGIHMASGVYIAKMTTARYVFGRKMTLLK